MKLKINLEFYQATPTQFWIIKLFLIIKIKCARFFKLETLGEELNGREIGAMAQASGLSKLKKYAN